MGVWIAKPRLERSELIRWKQLANRSQGSRAVGGRLYLTKSRLVFQPTRLDSAIGGKAWAAELSEITDVQEFPPNTPLTSSSLFSGALRKRLQLNLTSGEIELFVVNRLPEVVRVIGSAVRAAM